MFGEKEVDGGGYRGGGFGKGLRVGVHEADGEAVRGGHLSDSGAHLTAAYHSDHLYFRHNLNLNLKHKESPALSNSMPQ